MGCRSGSRKVWCVGLRGEGFGVQSSAMKGLGFRGMVPGVSIWVSVEGSVAL